MLADHLRGPGGGAERLMAGLAMHLSPERFDVVVCTTRPSEGQLMDTLAAAGLELLQLDRRNRMDVAPLGRLFGTLRARRIDVLHAHKFGSNVWGSVIGRLAHVPAVIAHEHTWSYEGNPLRRLLDGQVVGRLADAFVAVSERDADRMVALEGVPRKKILVMPNAYIPRESAGPRDYRRELGLTPDALVIGTVAVLRPQKALDVLIDAFDILRRTLPQVHLLIGGHGVERAKLEQRATELGVGDRVHFPGWCEDVGALLDNVDVAAMSSDFEGMPLFVIECMSHSVPLVSTDVGGVGELLEDGRSVTLVPRRDPPALARALEALLRDPQRGAAQATAAHALGPGQYSIEQVTQQFASLYERLVAEKEASAAGR